MTDSTAGQPIDQDDPVVAEVRAAREALLAAANYDLEELARRLRVQQAAGERRVISRSPRRVGKDSAA